MSEDPRAAALKALMPPNMRELLAHPRSAVGRMATYEEALALIENMVGALNRTPRLPIQTVAIREEDGTLTIRVAPDAQG